MKRHEPQVQITAGVFLPKQKNPTKAGFLKLV
jgi:hypothetical protein